MPAAAPVQRVPPLPAPVAPSSAGTAVTPPDVGSPTRPIKIVMGVFTPSAENAARDAQCGVTPIASLDAKGPGFERYAVTCESGPAMRVLCEMGNCRVLP